jgi:hypothetical protein
LGACSTLVDWPSQRCHLSAAAKTEASGRFVAPGIEWLILMVERRRSHDHIRVNE